MRLIGYPIQIGPVYPLADLSTYYPFEVSEMSDRGIVNQTAVLLSS